MLCLARLMRCAMVASGTRNAWAISAVVKPPTARRVSAIAEGGVSAGWHDMNSSSNVSSCSSGASRSGRRHHGAVMERAFGFTARACALAAHVIGPAPHRDLDQPAARMRRHAVLRPSQRRGDQRFLHRIFGSGEVAAKTPQDGAEHLRRERAQQGLDHLRLMYQRNSGGGPLITSRTSIAMFSGLPPAAGAADASAAIA